MQSGRAALSGRPFVTARRGYRVGASRRSITGTCQRRRDTQHDDRAIAQKVGNHRAKAGGQGKGEKRQARHGPRAFAKARLAHHLAGDDGAQDQITPLPTPWAAARTSQRG